MLPWEVRRRKEHLIAVYGLRGDRIFSSRTSNFDQQVHEVNNGTEIVVVLNILDGELLSISWESLAKFGRFVEIRERNFDRNSRLDMTSYFKSVIFAFIDLKMLREKRSTLIQSLSIEVMNLFRCGK